MILLQSSGPDDWQRLLAEPDKQWRTGYSARSLAYCWEHADGLPTEISALFSTCSDFAGETPDLLLAIPEHKVPLPGGRRESQNDLFAILKCSEKTISMTVEGKVDEPFGPMLSKWLADSSEGKRTRLAYIQDLLGLPGDLPDSLYYQLLHRTASAVIEAERFKTDAAAMIVHSFSQDRTWFEAYAQFLELLGVSDEGGVLVSTRLPSGRSLYLGWATGNARFLST